MKVPIFLLLYFGYELVSAITESQYIKTKSFPEKLECLAESKNSMLDEVPAKSVSYCSLKCSLYYPECRRFRFDMELKLCTLYPSGENCIALPDRVQHCVCYRLRHICDDVSCSRCPIGYYGNRCEHVAKDCTDWKNQGYTLPKGISFIRPNGVDIFEVYCNFKWNYLLMQSRVPECLDMDFNRTWSDYASGFGRATGNHWLGLRNINAVLNQTPKIGYQLYVRVKTPVGSKHQCFYHNFDVSGESSNFTILVGSYQPETLGNALSQSLLNIDGQQFSTFDRDFSNGCPVARQGGWWYLNHPDCSMANINGLKNDIEWVDTNGDISDFQEVELRLMRL